jgi:histidine triad (HIT) family protein
MEPTMIECLGCRLVKQMEPVNVVYEDHHVVCILDITPFNDGHLLIMPRQHYLDIDEIDEDTRNAIMNASVKMSKLLKKVFNPDGLTICQNGGIFNDLSHYHMHVIPRFSGDGFSWSEPKNELKTTRTLSEVKSILTDNSE